jgi:hypothetical protein
MLCRGGHSSSNTLANSSAQGVGAEVGHRLVRFVLWLLRTSSDEQAALPVRVFYKFDSGRWLSRSTHQLQKVYRCR